MTATLTATARDAGGTAIAGKSFTWQSSNAAIASVSGGVVTGVAPGGPVTITATSDGKSATAQVTVTAAPVQVVEVTPPTASLQAVAPTISMAEIRLDLMETFDLTRLARHAPCSLRRRGSAIVCDARPAGAWQGGARLPVKPRTASSRRETEM